ncbi:hypothetical protein M2401_003746 [Pseudomonas sp. JUb42]|jgi:hypothetical protein|uniref:hypothetical protein n=1 Tax=Pseudomonas sp. JUb42 TaxID=2940611 RepID=UPI002167D448|nr:hypothetical protein [Pseudomonas sp. JUb42]MCS3469996.1 hypothetical protein [Pseudomonas sp. JUb42]
MIRQIPKVALLLGALALAGQAEAHGGGGNWAGPAVVGAIVGGVVGAAVASGPRPVYVQQAAPVYVQQPVYAAPPPVYYQQPVVVAPPPVYYRPQYYGPPPGYYGRPHGYYGGGRW